VAAGAEAADTAPDAAPCAAVTSLGAVSDAGVNGVSTITWFTALRLANGWQTMRAKLVSLRRSTRTTRATGRPGA